ncbi:MAG: hypothetical protein AAGA75_23630 [Cyanobacteria bacterium P01_E01_bin.6]
MDEIRPPDNAESSAVLQARNALAESRFCRLQSQVQEERSIPLTFQGHDSRGVLLKSPGGGVFSIGERDSNGSVRAGSIADAVNDGGMMRVGEMPRGLVNEVAEQLVVGALNYIAVLYRAKEEGKIVFYLGGVFPQPLKIAEYAFHSTEEYSFSGSFSTSSETPGSDRGSDIPATGFPPNPVGSVSPSTLWKSHAENIYTQHTIELGSTHESSVAVTLVEGDSAGGFTSTSTWSARVGATNQGQYDQKNFAGDEALASRGEPGSESDTHVIDLEESHPILVTSQVFLQPSFLTTGMVCGSTTSSAVDASSSSHDGSASITLKRVNYTESWCSSEGSTIFVGIKHAGNTGSDNGFTTRQIFTVNALTGAIAQSGTVSSADWLSYKFANQYDRDLNYPDNITAYYEPRSNTFFNTAYDRLSGTSNAYKVNYGLTDQVTKGDATTDSILNFLTTPLGSEGTAIVTTANYNGSSESEVSQSTARIYSAGIVGIVNSDYQIDGYAIQPL